MCSLVDLGALYGQQGFRAPSVVCPMVSEYQPLRSLSLSKRNFSFFLILFLWLHCAFVATGRLSPTEESGGYSLLSTGLLLWCTGLAALRHVGSSWTRVQTCVPCIGRQILNHWSTWEVLERILLSLLLPASLCLSLSLPLSLSASLFCVPDPLSQGPCASLSSSLYITQTPVHHKIGK